MLNVRANGTNGQNLLHIQVTRNAVATPSWAKHMFGNDTIWMIDASWVFGLVAADFTRVSKFAAALAAKLGLKALSHSCANMCYKLHKVS